MRVLARTISSAAVALGLWFMLQQETGAQERRPNIVVIVADDMGYADLGIHGATDVRTPNIDALAKSGIRFTDAYVSGPYCSPTRAGLLTGRYPQRFGFEFNPPRPFGLPVEEVTIAQRLKSAGYRTAIFGKWHLGFGSEQHPMSRGFDEFYGFLGAAHGYHDVGPEANPVLEGRTPVAHTPYLTDAFGDRAVDFIQRQKAQPFFLYLAFNAVHTPMHATDKYVDRFKHIIDQPRRTYAAMLSAMDDAIGRTLAALRSENLEENTLIFFFSDNGGPTMMGTSVNASSNAPLRGSKRQTWEGGIRVPFIISWKGRLTAGKVDSRPIIQLDVMPTALVAAGVQVAPAWKLDGVDLMPYLTGAQTTAPHDVLYWRFGGMMAVRKGNWKLVKSVDGLIPPDPSVLKVLTGAELYNLATDLGEKNDLAQSQPERVKELSDVWQRWNQQLAKPAWPPGSAAATGTPSRMR